MFKKIIFSIILFFMFLSDLSFASLYDEENSYIQTTSSGEINWSKLTARAKGSNRVFLEDSDKKAADYTPEEAAKVDACYKMMETIKGIPISTSYHFDDAFFLYDEIKNNLLKLVMKSKTIEKTGPSEKGVIEIILELDFKGEILDIMFPKKENLPDGIGKAFQGRGRYTSIIFDASETDLKPVLLPQVIDDKEKTYYILDKRNRKAAVKNGFAKYFKSIEAAKKAKAVGRMPFVIDYLMLSRHHEDTLESPANILEKVRNDAFYTEILRRCKVIFIIK